MIKENYNSSLAYLEKLYPKMLHFLLFAFLFSFSGWLCSKKKKKKLFIFKHILRKTKRFENIRHTFLRCIQLIGAPMAVSLNHGILLSKLFWPTVRKKCSKGREKLLKIRGWRPRICKIFQIIRTTYSNSEMSEQFLVI